MATAETGKNSPGRGRILCGACGTPTRDHKIGPCDMWLRGAVAAPPSGRGPDKHRRKR